MSVYVCVSETKRRGFCVATRKFIIFYLLKRGEARVKASHDMFIFSTGGKSYLKYEDSGLKAWNEGRWTLHL